MRAADGGGLERLGSYLLRPSLSLESLTLEQGLPAAATRGRKSAGRLDYEGYH